MLNLDTTPRIFDPEALPSALLASTIADQHATVLGSSAQAGALERPPLTGVMLDLTESHPRTWVLPTAEAGAATRERVHSPATSAVEDRSHLDQRHAQPPQQHVLKAQQSPAARHLPAASAGRCGLQQPDELVVPHYPCVHWLRSCYRR